MRRALAIMTLLGALCLAVPARAEVCDHYPETLSEAEITALRQRLRNMMPSRHAALINRIAILNRISAPSRDEGAEALSPEAHMPSDGSPPTIEIPTGLRRNLCLMSHWSRHMISLPLEQFQGVVASILSQRDQCLRTQSQAECFRRAIAMESALAAHDRAAHDNTAFFEDKVEAALYHMVAHEVGHIILADQVPEAVARLSANVELRADLLAYRALILAGYDYRTTAFIMIPFQVLDWPPEDRSRQSHPNPQCRLAIGMRISQLLAPEIAMTFKWAMVPSADRLARQVDSGGLRAEAERLRGQDFTSDLWEAQIAACPNLSFAAIERTKADYDALLSAIDANASLAGDAPAQIAALLRHVPATDEVRATFGLMLAFRLVLLEQEAHRRQDPAMRRRLTTLFRHVRERFDLDEMSAIARGILLLHGGINAYELAPAGSRIDTLIDTFAADLAEAERYLPNPETWKDLNFQMGNLSMLRGDCLEADRRFRRIVAHGDAQAAAAAATYAIVGEATPAACARIAAYMRGELRRERGWQ